MREIVFYTTTDGGYGYRERSFDWKVGDKIRSQDGKQIQVIFKVSQLTPKISKFLRSVMSKCKTYAGSGKEKLMFSSDDNQLYIKREVWKDGTGIGFFKSQVSILPDAE